MDITRKIIISSLIILFGNTILGVSIYQANQKLYASELWISHTEAVISKTIEIFSLAKDIKADSRDFILTGEEQFASSLSKDSKTVILELQKLKNLIADNTAQQKDIASLENLMLKRISFSLKSVELRKAQGAAAAVTFTSAHNSDYHSAYISYLIEAIQKRENILLQQRKLTNANSLKAYTQLSLAAYFLMITFTVGLLIIMGKYLFQSKEKEERAAELVVAEGELFFEGVEKKKRAGELILADLELVFQRAEKKKRARELVIANEELLYQNGEKDKRAAELVVANKELLFQNNEKEKRAGELLIANKELLFQNGEKIKRSAELAFANEELTLQSLVRMVAEGKLSQSESRLKEAQAIAHTGNFEVDTKNEFETWSDEMYKIYGINKHEVTPSKELFLSFIHPDDRARVKASMYECNQTFENSASEFRLIRPDGIMRYVYSEARFELDKDNKLIRIYGVIIDVTDSKMAEMERTRMLNELVVRNNDLEQFAYIISHNLRAPLANIIGASTAMEDPDLTDEDHDIYNRAISTSVIRLDGVVKDLNHILQVKADVNEIKELVTFSELVTDIKFSIKNLIEKYNVTVIQDFGAVDQLITLKPYLYSIFYNLISNSIKYRQENANSLIEIASRKTDNTIQLIFKDNGLGINLDKKGQEIFGLYKRFHTHVEGKGMGLYMVKTQVQMLGGHISVKSEENVGTEFLIEFPLGAKV